MKNLKNYLSVLSMLMILLLLVFASCSGNEEDLICKVSVGISEGGIGVASNSEVVSGEEVTLKAVPEDTYRFVNWTVNGKEVSKENPYTTTITATTQFKPNFEKDNYTIKVTAGEGGEVTPTEESVLNASKVTLTATPNEGYSFVNWTVNGEEVSTSATYTVTVTKDVEYIANFITHKVTVIAGEGGTATASKTQVGHNGKVTLTAEPNKDYHFFNWTVNGEEVSTNATYTATVIADTEFKANFRETYKPTGLENGKDFVDLGLSVKWATCNVGATTPEGYGDYFAWGETSPKTTYNWSTYKYCNGSSFSITKYCTDSKCGIVDNKTTLELIDDAVHVNWGGNWRIPTKEEFDELITECDWTWTSYNGVNGYRVTSKKNGNSIFLPAGGSRYHDNLHYARNYGFYWSNSLSTTDYNHCAYVLYFGMSYVRWYSLGYRYDGQSVRAVCE